MAEGKDAQPASGPLVVLIVADDSADRELLVEYVMRAAVRLFERGGRAGNIYPPG